MQSDELTTSCVHLFADFDLGYNQILDEAVIANLNKFDLTGLSYLMAADNVLSTETLNMIFGQVMMSQDQPTQEITELLALASGEFKLDEQASIKYMEETYENANLIEIL